MRIRRSSSRRSKRPITQAPSSPHASPIHPPSGGTQAPHAAIDPKQAAIILPAFVITMAAEALVLKNRPKRTFGDLDGATRDELSDPSLPADPLVPVGYETRDTVASLGMLAGNLVANAAVFGLTHRIDRWAYRHRVANLGSTRFGFTGAMMAWDFLYYWDHRWMHEVRLLWANHVSHHSSERYNLSTALRQPWSGILTHWVFLPMPLLGFTPAMTSKAGLYNLLYQYWVHTEAIDRLPAPVEAVMNTASHHRVHHGANPQYLDKNYAGIFIVWDKLFGTFEPEVRKVKYGLTKNIDTFNPMRIAYHEFADIARDIRAATGVRNKLGHIFGRPGWTPSGRRAGTGPVTVTTAD
nr:sterol desaturase family protein [Candidatus Microthrix sp.]